MNHMQQNLKATFFLQEKDCIGLNCPKELLNKTGLQNTMMFGIRGGRAVINLNGLIVNS